MAYQKPPNISRRAIDRAGDVLISGINDRNKLDEGRNILNQWRACHAYPMNTFNSTLRAKVRNGKFGEDFVIAQRLKRAPTIIRKLREGVQNEIRLLNMQDIAGVRAILPTIKDVRKLEKDYRFNKQLQHILHTRSKDYIQEPKSKDGYRSIHLIYKYRNKLHPYWDGLSVELQIRTKLQHSWAMAVETMHAFLGKTIKTRHGQKGDEKWIDFFKLVSSAFAIIEGTPVVEAHRKLTYEQILKSIRDYEKELKVMDKLKAYPKALNKMFVQAKKSYFHLIILDTENKKVFVNSFSRLDIKGANQAYTEAEKKYEDNELVEPVLVSTTEGSLEKAYSSFFANTKDFSDNLANILSGRWTKLRAK